LFRFSQGSELSFAEQAFDVCRKTFCGQPETSDGRRDLPQAMAAARAAPFLSPGIGEPSGPAGEAPDAASIGLSVIPRGRHLWLREKIAARDQQEFFHCLIPRR
jgi:hypothetical protein